jgi:ABC-type multidrug transport system fused ATPase/permease subunit
MLTRTRKFIDEGTTDIRELFGLYRWLWQFGATGNKRVLWQIVVMETMGAACLIGALLSLLAGLSMTGPSIATGAFNNLMPVDVPKEYRNHMLIAFIASSVPLYYFSALLALRTAFKARGIARDVQTRMVKKLLVNFAETDGGQLSLDSSDRRLMSSGFTTGSQTCGVALETLLKATRPLSQLLLIVIALFVINPKFSLLFMLAMFVLVPIIYMQQKLTISSSAKVYGEERRQANRLISSIFESFSKRIEPINVDKNAIESAYLGNAIITNALDDFDKWKMAVERGRFMMDVGRVIVLFVLLITSVILSEMHLITWPVLIGFILVGMRIQNAMSTLLIRSLTLARFIPILQRARRLEHAFKNATDGVRTEAPPNTTPTASPTRRIFLLCDGKMIRKEMIGMLLENLRTRLSEDSLDDFVIEPFTLLLFEKTTPQYGHEEELVMPNERVDNSTFERAALALAHNKTVALVVREPAALRSVEHWMQEEKLKQHGTLIAISSLDSSNKAGWDAYVDLRDESFQAVIEETDFTD